MDDIDVIFDDKWRKLDEFNYVNTKKKLFIPNNQSKGIISRSIMYMSYNYNYSFSKVIDSNNLIDWCLKFPPNKNEYIHNIIVYKYQKNKNKFIDLYHHKNYKEMICDLFA
jgi:endonuclease I